MPPGNFKHSYSQLTVHDVHLPTGTGPSWQLTLRASGSLMSALADMLLSL